MNYNHTQIGHLMIYSFMVVILFFTYIVYNSDYNSVSITVICFILLILSSFLSLNVKIDEEYLKIKFGYGIFRKKFLLKDIESARSVRNHWCCGWGIRMWFWPNTIIYNVSGFDAVEIILKNGKIYRIGTDEPYILQDVLKENILRIKKENK